MLVERGSHAEIAGNVIEGNAGGGIEVTRGSGVDLKIGAATVTMPNNTAANRKNGGYGMHCSLGGYVAGPLGTLDGVKGAKEHRPHGLRKNFGGS